MVKERHPLRPWVLDGIDPDGPMVRRIKEVAAKDGLTVGAWIERWLDTVLRHHYPDSAQERPAQAVARRVAATQADMRRNVEALTENLSRLYQNVERAHQRVEGIEEDVHSTEGHIRSMDEDMRPRPASSQHGEKKK